MPDTIKQKISDDLKATLNAVEELVGETDVNAPDILDLETAILPKAFIDWNTEEENVEEHTTESEAWVWRPIISIYYRVPNPQDNREPGKFLGLIHKALTEDRSRGGYADETKRLSDDVIEIESESGLVQGILMIWEIKYTHTKNDPYSQYA